MPESSNDTDTLPSNVKDDAGLYDIFKVGDLDFRLDSVALSRNKKSVIEDYDFMVWYFTITNNGKSIENVSDCGILLFEDSSQYNVGYDEMPCSSHIIVPTGKIKTYSIFYFSNIPSYDSIISWEEVPNSKIAYFSQQNQGIVKYAVDKKEIKYTYEYDVDRFHYLLNLLNPAKTLTLNSSSNEVIINNNQEDDVSINVTYKVKSNFFNIDYQRSQVFSVGANTEEKFKVNENPACEDNSLCSVAIIGYTELKQE